MADITMAQMGRNKTYSNMKAFVWFITLFIGILEVFAWLSLAGNDLTKQIIFGMAALIFVYSRNQIAIMGEYAHRSGKLELAQTMKIMGWLSVVITCYFMYTPLSSHFDSLAKKAKAETASVQLAQQKVDAATAKLKSLETAKITENDAESAVALREELLSQKKAELKQNADAKAEHDARVNEKLDLFWRQFAVGDLTNDQIMSRDCGIKTISGKRYKTAAGEACEKLHKIKEEFKEFKPPFDLKEIDLKLSELQPKVAHANQVESARKALSVAEQEFAVAMQTAGVGESSGHNNSLVGFENTAKSIGAFIGKELQVSTIYNVLIIIVIAVIVALPMLLTPHLEDLRSPIERGTIPVNRNEMTVKETLVRWIEWFKSFKPNKEVPPVIKDKVVKRQDNSNDASNKPVNATAPQATMKRQNDVNDGDNDLLKPAVAKLSIGQQARQDNQYQGGLDVAEFDGEMPIDNSYKESKIGFAASKERQMATRQIITGALKVDDVNELKKRQVTRKMNAERLKFYRDFDLLLNRGMTATAAFEQLKGVKDSAQASKAKAQLLKLKQDGII